MSFSIQRLQYLFILAGVFDHFCLKWTNQSLTLPLAAAAVNKKQSRKMAFFAFFVFLFGCVHAFFRCETQTIFGSVCICHCCYLVGFLSRSSRFSLDVFRFGNPVRCACLWYCVRRCFCRHRVFLCCWRGSRLGRLVSSFFSHRFFGTEC